MRVSILNKSITYIFLHYTRILSLAVIALLASGCDSQTPKQTHEFLVQCQNEQISVIETSLNQGIKVNSASPAGMTCLMVAAKEKRTELVKRLLDKGANPNQKMDSTTTALMLAVGPDSDPELVTRLIEAKSDLKALSADGSSLLMIALGNDDSIQIPREAISELTVKPETDGLREFNNDPFQMPNLETVKLLLDSGVDLNAINHESSAALDYAIQMEYDPEVLTLLINAGADVNLSGRSGITPLIRASMTERADYMKLLLSHGANVAGKDKSGETAMFYAARHGSPEVIALLIAHGADINAQTPQGTTPLMAAIMDENSQSTETIIKSGADINLKDKDGKSALGISDGNIRELLIKSGATIGGQEVWMAQADLKQCMSKLFDHAVIDMIASATARGKPRAYTKVVQQCGQFDDAALSTFLDKFSPEISVSDGSNIIKSDYYGVPIECQFTSSSETVCKRVD